MEDEKIKHRVFDLVLWIVELACLAGSLMWIATHFRQIEQNTSSTTGPYMPAIVRLEQKVDRLQETVDQRCGGVGGRRQPGLDQPD